MLKKLIAFSLNHSAIVILLAVGLLVVTMARVSKMPVDVFPELNAPTVVILTEAEGFTADEVEQYVSFPVESAMTGLTGVRRVRSSSSLSLSLVWVEFEWGSDIYLGRQVVNEALSRIRERLPEQVHTEIAPITGITGEIMLLSLSAENPRVTPLALRRYAEFDLTQRLMSVSGVAQVVSIGGELPEYQVHVKPEMLRLYGLSVSDVVAAAEKAHSTASAGYLPNVQGKELPIRQDASVRDVNDVKQTIVAYHRGQPVTIGEVAEVEMGPTPPRGTGSVAGNSAVVIGVKKAPFTNTLDITKNIDRVLDEAKSSLPAGMKLNRHVMRQSDFIETSLHNLMVVLRDAGIFVAIVLILFLLNVRTTVITLTAIPLSVGMALLVMNGMGLTINVMTLGGLAIAIGELVDDAIIDVENVYRRLKENSLKGEGERLPVREVIFKASNEIRSSVVFATLIIVLVFSPLLFLQGIEGRFFQPMGIAYIVSILGSLLVALTVVPALCGYLMRNIKANDAGETDSWFARLVKRMYGPALKFSIKRRKLVMGGGVIAMVASLWIGSTFGTDFLPEFNEGTFTVFIDAPPGTALSESDSLVRGLDKSLSMVEGVASVVRRTGRAERDEHAHGPNRSEIEITVKPGYGKEEIKRRIDRVLKSVPGVNIEVGSPIGHRLSHVLSGTQADVAINIFGNDLATLRQIASEVDVAISGVGGVRDVLANREAMVEQLSVNYRHEDLQRWGLTPADAAEQVAAAFKGVHVTDINDGVSRYALVVRLHPDLRESVANVKDLMLRGGEKQLVRLSEVADVTPSISPLGIQRENAKRKAVVSFNVGAGFNLGDTVAVVREKVDPIVQRYGYSVTYGGQFEAQQSASKSLYLMAGVVVVVIGVLLTIAFGSVKSALLVMANLPLALIGGIVAIFVSEGGGLIDNLTGLFGAGEYVAPVVSIASMVGFITLFGIAVRNGLLLVNHYAYLQVEEGADLETAVVRGSMERLVPILMTALTAVLGLLPLALAKGEPGSELLAPLAIVVLGGLVTSTFLNLIVIPAGYVMIGTDGDMKRKADDKIVV